VLYLEGSSQLHVGTIRSAAGLQGETNRALLVMHNSIESVNITYYPLVSYELPLVYYNSLYTMNALVQMYCCHTLLISKRAHSILKLCMMMQS
jgi:hypothetical protein